ncbi:MAG: hypothetical protein ACFFE4_11005 [Candidatus Thorarchaeota archaeon]
MSISNNEDGPENRIKKWLEQYVSFRLPEPTTSIKEPEEINEDHVNVAAYYLSLEKKSYDTLCWILAEKILKKKDIEPTEDEIRQKAEEISNLGKSYDELCYLNAEIDILRTLKF